MGIVPPQIVKICSDLQPAMKIEILYFSVERHRATCQRKRSWLSNHAQNWVRQLADDSAVEELVGSDSALYWLARRIDAVLVDISTGPGSATVAEPPPEHFEVSLARIASKL